MIIITWLAFLFLLRKSLDPEIKLIWDYRRLIFHEGRPREIYHLWVIVTWLNIVSSMERLKNFVQKLVQPQQLSEGSWILVYLALCFVASMLLTCYLSSRQCVVFFLVLFVLSHVIFCYLLYGVPFVVYLLRATFRSFLFLCDRVWARPPSWGIFSIIKKYKFIFT